MRGFVVASFMILAAFGWSQKQPPASQKDTSNKQHAQTVDHPPLSFTDNTFPVRQVRPNINPSATKASQQPYSQKEPVDERLARFTLGLVIVGVIQVFTMIAQAFYMAKTLSATQKAITDARNTSEQDRILTTQVAEASMLTASTAKTTLEMVQRGILIVGHPIHGQLQHRTEFFIPYRNAGNTKIDVQRYSIECVCRFSPPINSDLSWNSEHFYTVGAHQDLQMTTGIIFNPGELDQIIAPNAILRLYLIGVFEYVDIFNVNHATRFGYVWQPDIAGFTLIEQSYSNYAD